MISFDFINAVFEIYVLFCSQENPKISLLLTEPLVYVTICSVTD